MFDLSYYKEKIQDNKGNILAKRKTKNFEFEFYFYEKDGTGFFNVYGNRGLLIRTIRELKTIMFMTKYKTLFVTQKYNQYFVRFKIII